MDKRQSRRRRVSPDSQVPSTSKHTRKDKTSSATEAVEHFAKVMAGFFKDFENGPHRETAKGEVVPSFNPEDNEHNSITWCAKVDELREVFGWSEEATIYFAMSKLQGLARTWYKGLPTIKFTWDEWKDQIQAAFPPMKDYYEILRDMMRRRKQTDETYSKYYYEKMALLTQCEISGPKAVSCIIGGIDDEIVKTGAQAGNYETPVALFKYLSKLKKPSSRASSKNSFKRKLPVKEMTQRSSNHGNKHIASACTQSDQERDKCTFCQRAGHNEKNCYVKARKTQSAKPVA